MIESESMRRQVVALALAVVVVAAQGKPKKEVVNTQNVSDFVAIVGARA